MDDSNAIQSRQDDELSGKIDALEAHLLDMPQIEMPLTHRFAPGVYAREIFMPADTFVIGQRHKTEHFNIVLTGRARVLIDGKAVQEVKAGDVFVSGEGVRKVLYIIEDMRWMTIHPTDETDVPTLESQLVEPTKAFLEHKEMQKLIQSQTEEV